MTSNRGRHSVQPGPPQRVGEARKLPKMLDPVGSVLPLLSSSNTSTDTP